VTRPSFNGFDRAKQRGQIQTFDKTPNRAHAMIVRNQFFQAHRTPLYLPPLSRAKPRRRHASPLRPSLRGQCFEEFLVLVPSHRSPHESNPGAGFYAMKTAQTLPKTAVNRKIFSL